jgi:hypothetical protein
VVNKVLKAHVEFRVAKEFRVHKDKRVPLVLLDIQVQLEPQD